MVASVTAIDSFGKASPKLELMSYRYFVKGNRVLLIPPLTIKENGVSAEFCILYDFFK